MKRSLLALSALGFGLAGVAHADVQSGELVAASDDATVFAVRGSETVAISVGDQLLAGDRLITSGEGSITVAYEGCSIDLPASANFVLGDNFCDDKSLGQASGQLRLGGANLGGGLGATETIIAVLAAGGIIAGIIIAADNDDDDAPASP